MKCFYFFFIKKIRFNLLLSTQLIRVVLGILMHLAPRENHKMDKNLFRCLSTSPTIFIGKIGIEEK